MAVFLRRPLYFLVRGDFFRKSIFNFLLRSLNMIPIFRKRDGNFRDLKSNYHSFAACYQALRAKRTIMIFPEGNAVHEKRLRPIQKGISRLAYGALQAETELEELFIVPVGVSYTYSERPRSEIMISCGHPISVKAILDANDNHFPSFDKDLRQQVTKAMMANLVHVEDSDSVLTEQLQQVRRANLKDRSIFPVLSGNDELLKADREIIQTIQSWEEEKKENLQKEASQFLQALQQLRIPVKTLSQKRLPGPLTLITLILTAIPVWVGYVFVFIPARVAKYIADTKVKRTEFYSPIIVSTHLGTFLIYYIIWVILSAFVFKSWVLLGASILLGLLAFASLLWREELQAFIWGRRKKQLGKDRLSTLNEQYQSLLKKISNT